MIDNAFGLHRRWPSQRRSTASTPATPTRAGRMPLAYSIIIFVIIIIIIIITMCIYIYIYI